MTVDTMKTTELMTDRENERLREVWDPTTHL